MSFDIILPFLLPIAPLIQDPDVSEIMVNGGGRVFLERNGQLEEAEDVHVVEKNLQVAVRTVARTLGDDVSVEQPILDARLPDGSRVAAVIPPCSLGGTTLTISGTSAASSNRRTANQWIFALSFGTSRALSTCHHWRNR